MSVMFNFKSAYSENWKHFRDTRVCKRMLAVAMAGLIAGCSTIRYGGAPEPSFDVNKDLEQLAKQFEPADSISKFYNNKNPTVDDRNEFITGRITMMNIRYIQFVRQLTTDQQLLDTAAAMLVLGMNIAGASFAAAGTKTVLAAVSAGLTGSKEAIDKNYFFDKTIPALVGQMNADRKKALIPLLAGANTTTLKEYSFAQAVTDLHNYYFAGTFAGAIQSIQADAAIKESKADIDIDKLRKSTFSEDQPSVQLQKWLFDADGNPRKENADKLRAWMDSNGFKELAIQKLLDHPDLKEWRQKAIKELKVPNAS